MRFFRPVVFLVALVLSGCGSSQEQAAPPEKKDLQVVATTPVLADFARNVGGESVTVYEVLPPGVDPHDYEPTAADLQALGNADVIIKNGVGLEEWLERTVQSSGTKAPVVDTSEGVTLRRTAAGADPHIWHSTLNAKIMVANISRAFQAADPERSVDYQAGERGYNAQLDGLSRDIKRSVASLNDKRLVTNHDSLGYYADEYGLNVVATVIPTFDSQAEVGPAQVQALIGQLRGLGVKAIFVEAAVPDDVATAVGQGAGVKVVGGENSIYGDSLGPEGSPADTYLKMERHNTNVIVSNLS